MLKLIKNASQLLSNGNKLVNSQLGALIHTSNVMEKKRNTGDIRESSWTKWNKIIFEPQQPHEEPRPAFICHQKNNIKYSPKKMWYIAAFVRGMSIDEAIKQLTFVGKKGATAVKETLLEAQELAVKNHNVEFKSNLWIAESFCGKGLYFKGIRRHAKGRVGKIEYKHCHYYVKLEEGKPPAHYYLPHPKTPEDMLNEWMENMRKRKISNSL